MSDKDVKLNTLNNTLEVFFKCNIHLTCDPVILILGIFPREIYAHSNSCT